MAVLLALSVVLAGCGLLGQETDVEGPPPGESTGATATTAGPFGGEELPPGVTTDGVSDVDALMAAHGAALNGSSVTLELDYQLTVNDTLENTSFRAKVLPDGDRGWLRVTLQDGTGTYYTGDGQTYFREVVNGSVNYGTTDQVSALPQRPRFGIDNWVRRAVQAGEWEPVGTVERDGETLFEFEATSVDPPDVNTSNNTTVGSDGRLLVDRQGVVRSVSVSTTVENERGTVRYGLAVSVDEVGTTTIEEPSWLDNAR